MPLIHPEERVQYTFCEYCPGDVNSRPLFRISEEGAGDGRRFSPLSSEQILQLELYLASTRNRAVTVTLMMELGLTAGH